ncbi:MAG: nucleoside 2-deoxyribosyltransferase [Candidatus Bipolaricaulia bacterium]
MLIYFAGPLFNEAEKRFNLELTEKLEALGFEVFLPQRDGVEDEKPSYNQMPAEERVKVIFEIDEQKVLESDIFLFILDGRVPDEGACVELGIVYCHKKLQKPNRLIVGLQTDMRGAFLDMKLNVMVKVPLDYVVESEEELLSFLRDYRDGHAM